MVRWVTGFAVVVVAGAAFAQSGPAVQHPKHGKSAAPATHVEDDDDVTKMPRDVKNWFSGAVGDILNGSVGDPSADRAKR